MYICISLIFLYATGYGWKYRTYKRPDTILYLWKEKKSFLSLTVKSIEMIQFYSVFQTQCQNILHVKIKWNNTISSKY